MTGDPIVSVIMATYNSSNTLKLALKTVLWQDFTDFEIWVVGDSCTDDTEEVVLSFGDRRINWVNMRKNSGGQGAPNNEGIRRARGEYIAYLGHDDLWFPWHLSTLVRHIRESGADFVHPLSALFSPSGLESMVGPPSEKRTNTYHFTPPPSCWLHRKDVVEDIGYWGDHIKLHRGVDFDYLRKFQLAGKKISFIPKLTLVKFPSHMWSNYTKNTHQGQTEYFDELKEDPETLEIKILRSAAVKFSIELYKKRSVYSTFRIFFKTFVFRIFDLYGRYRWPLKQFLIWRFQRIRKKVKKKRGLSA